MPAVRPFGRPTPVRADVHPLLASSDAGEASSDLWAALLPRSTEKPKRLAVAIEWAPEHRLPPSARAGAARKLVLWVSQSSAEPSDKISSRPRLYVPEHLLPSYVPTPAEVTVHAHEPVSLSLAVVQPTGGELASSDLEPLYPDAVNEPDGDPVYGYDINGSVHWADEETQAGTILREGGIISLGSGCGFRVLMAEPVQQGLVTRDTRVVVANKPSDAFGDFDDDRSVGGSFAPTHRSLVEEFDADAFLASSLARSLASLTDDEPAAQHDLDDSSASSLTNSGSMTPRPGLSGLRSPSPVAAPDDVLQLDSPVDEGMRFVLVPASGRGPQTDEDDSDVCYAGVWALGRAGVFEGDWVCLRAVEQGAPGRTRIARVVAWERLDEEMSDLPPNALIVPPGVRRALFPLPAPHLEVIMQPTPFGARRPTLPVAKSMTLARVATAQGVDKRYERAWLRGLRNHFAGGGDEPESHQRLVRRGDVISVPVRQGKPLAEGEEPEDEDDDDERVEKDTALAYFIVTALAFEPLMPLEDDFSSTISSKARAGELGCWVDAGPGGETSLMLSGVERGRVAGRAGDLAWHGMPAAPPPYYAPAAGTLRDLAKSAFSPLALARLFPLSVLVKGSREAGKRSFVHAAADELGLSVVEVSCYDVIGDTPQTTEGTLRARFDKARQCAPSILLLTHLEAFAPQSSGSAPPRPPPVVKVVEDLLAAACKAGAETSQPVAIFGTTSNIEAVPRDMQAVFKHELALPAPSSGEREAILTTCVADTPLAPDVVLSHVAAQAAALTAGDLASLVERARDMALARACAGAPSATDALLAGVALTAADLTTALSDARASYADSIGAPRIPNVSWDDVGGLAAVKNDILDTVQLPLEHPELFGEGMKKRSGILLYGPPGTGKTLLAKAVATSCAANFLSVKGPELLNMYIGESEANVRRVFEKARDASPCVIFMDELDSVAPKRGNQGDSGGVMDRIVSQLLAELDGMSGGRGQVVVMAATNRPDLLDPALLRPGRFDRMLYLSVPETHAAQRDVLAALTRKFTLDPALSLDDLSERLPFTYTGADLYALCADAMLRSMTRVAEEVDTRVAELDAAPLPRAYPKPLTAQYYLASMATSAETDVVVGESDFLHALERLQPSVSSDEMAHYRRVQDEFKGFNIGGDK
ncbi:hypothetical protein CspHIS471_0108040 [Cutaneotrichosporon sp. HIS471]|nr:hypothetical protein CspHIS471_0108040 [Cutaneotrichosporon sp. HIS471]